MPYIKIEDPNIIDLAAWHQVINVVNQHSDNLTALTNNFGLGWNPVTDDDGSWRTVYDLGTQTIQYGRTKMNAGVNKILFGDITVYDEIISFPNGFSSNPNVVATISRTGSSSASISDFFVTICDIGHETFKARIRQQNKSDAIVDGTGVDVNVQSVPDAITWYVNWIAIGPQV